MFLTEKQLVSISPANGSIIGNIPVSSHDEIRKKVLLAHKAANEWKSFGAGRRSEILRPLMESFRQNQEEIAQMTSRETGKPISESRADLMGDFAYLDDFLNNGKKYIEDEVVFRDESAVHRIIYEPRGVVACIVPWNYPFGNFIWSVIPNLVAGNTVILKHSEECPLTARFLEHILLALKGLPEGVFSAIYGDAEEGAFLVEQNLDMIWFTGSSAVGRDLAAIAGRKQIRAILEMGGSNPAIILDDAPLDCIEKVYRSRFANCGQVCDATKRLLVHMSLFDKVVESLVQRVDDIIIGDPMCEKTDLGPLVSMRQLKILESQVNDAIMKGATLLAGGKRPEGFSGSYFAPTILTNINKNMRIWHEEVFGPVLPVVSFRDDDEAVQLANDTPYGLGAAIYSQNIARARHIAGRIDAGCIDINNGCHWQPCTPFGGFRASGMGLEHGRHGFQELCRVKVVAEG